MDDELEDKVFYQTYVSHMKILSKFAVGLTSINSPLAYTWKLFRLYVLRPEVIFCGAIIFILLLYLQAVDVWSRSLLGRLQATLGRHRVNRIKLLDVDTNAEHQHWQEAQQQSAAFAILGRRPRMEDRFIVEENINNTTGISLFAIFDGHGGEFAADFAKDILVKNIYNKIMEATTILLNRGDNGHADGDGDDYTEYNVSPYLKRKAAAAAAAANRASDNNKENEPIVTKQRRDSLRKAYSTSDDCSTSQRDEILNRRKTKPDAFISRLNALMGNADLHFNDPFINDDDELYNKYNNNNNNKNNNNNNMNMNNNNNNNNKSNEPPSHVDAKCYIENGTINFGKMITDEILAADYKLVEAARKTTNIAGTTALIAIIHGTRLVVANVGDSRGVMLDFRGNVIPLSFDHKPQQVRERKRIRDAGGFIALRGVWRVAGILATSRALGDYPLKDKNLVIANPDILTFELNDHKPSFLILASDGLWDTFSNEEACTYIKEHMNESVDYGAKGLAMQSYLRGSVDNITVMVIVFKNGKYCIGSAAPPTFDRRHTYASTK